MIHLHARSWFSFLAGGSPPQALVERAHALGQGALALTDLHGVYGAVRFANACRRRGVKPIFGATLLVEEDAVRYPLVLLCQDARGYENLCRLITLAHGNARLDPHLRFEQLRAAARDRLVALSGGPEGRLGAFLKEAHPAAAGQWLQRMAALFPGRCYVELVHRLQPDDGARVHAMARLAAQHGLPLVASNAVRYATPDDFPRYDALTCVRLGLTVGDRHPERPVNDSACLVARADLEPLIPYPEAFANTHRIAAQCTMDLLPGEVTPPTALLPPGTDAATYLRDLCLRGVVERYPDDAEAAARRQLDHELEVVIALDLCEFFLVVHEVVSWARSRGIRCHGRGSAANSIIAYCLGITTVDPLRHRLLFERFLHRGRKGMPDIDVDFDSERRLEVIEWMEDRFGAEHTAMTANVNTYRVKGAMREMMKVLGWDLDTIGRVGKILSHYDGMATVVERRGEFAAIVGGDSTLLDVLFALVASLRHCPRHLSLHNGGMILSRAPLAQHSPVQISANGVRQVQFDKEDVEGLGLIKFDVLGLRSLAVVSEALALHQADAGDPLDVDRLPADDPATFELIRRGQTMSVFQIESPGQWNLLSRVQPRTFDDLVIEVALFRPGPLQGGMVNPYVERRAGRQEVVYPHESLRAILHDTYGVILYQEQVLEVSHQFAGMSLEEADRFRGLMSKWRDPGDMSKMREVFVRGAIRKHGVTAELADEVFRQVAAFVGYGFCRSHAAAFAQIVYQTAWLKAHHPAAYMAAVLQHKPGFYPMSTVIEEIKHLRVPIRPLDIWKSGARYQLERGAIRIPLTQVKGMSEATAEAVVRARRDCATLDALRRRLALPQDIWDALARGGAFDTRGERRDALWDLGLLRDVSAASQGELFDLDLLDDDLRPELDGLDEGHLVAWDFATMDLSPRTHPVGLHRAALDRRKVARVSDVFRMRPDRIVQVAGIVVVLQRPPTAKGMLFLVLEDETGRLPVAVTPQAYERLKHTLRSATLLVEGRLQEAGANYRSLMTRNAWPLDAVLRGTPLDPTMGSC